MHGDRRCREQRIGQIGFDKRYDGGIQSVPRGTTLTHSRLLRGAE
jgi:hypothetical protein